MPKWVINILEYVLNALELETVEWLFDEEKHPTLAAVEDRYFTYISNMIQRLQAYRTKEVK